eukprot:Blabericola_migrator_1__10134@NODE_563_length_7579_cov_24_328940_g421_i0_p2_GENE_NODE_563_length_7579_cov_24_328940_g421_i0NODE_563_length_7579_cov_24_328940_g421_i0_p2_ORF_typecomplete_len975_score241_09Pkinase/PF00069_25/5e42Pkinase_Tyr/PF07714_17/1_1e34Kinaselike/PF14531_6/1_3e06Kdo/PF06293_14/3_7e06GLTT/PF01744_20/9_9e03GLTT/PF01744_20/3_1e03GLTT/PF01744_20/1_9e05GLTT/PF01744_20/57Pkinase_fungal/PF17667_1/8_7e05WaaY/PF06176_11/0_0001APH/PF01636_23/0_0013RIO1/PF01163_22/0_074_NODE_563_length_
MMDRQTLTAFYSPRETLGPSTRETVGNAAAFPRGTLTSTPSRRSFSSHSPQNLYNPFKLYTDLDALRSFDVNTGRRTLPTAMRAVRAKQARHNMCSPHMVYEPRPPQNWVEKLKSLVACTPRRTQRRSTIASSRPSRMEIPSPKAVDMAPQFHTGHPGQSVPIGPPQLGPKEMATRMPKSFGNQKDVTRYTEELYKTLQKMVPSGRVDVSKGVSTHNAPPPTRVQSTKRRDSLRRDPSLGFWDASLDNVTPGTADRMGLATKGGVRDPVYQPVYMTHVPAKLADVMQPVAFVNTSGKPEGSPRGVSFKSPQGVPSQPTQGVPTKGVPTQGMPTKGVPTQGVPTKGVPSKPMSPHGVPTQGVSSHAPQGVSSHAPQGVSSPKPKSPEAVSPKEEEGPPSPGSPSTSTQAVSPTTLPTRPVSTPQPKVPMSVYAAPVPSQYASAHPVSGAVSGDVSGAVPSPVSQLPRSSSQQRFQISQGTPDVTRFASFTPQHVTGRPVIGGAVAQEQPWNQDARRDSGFMRFQSANEDSFEVALVKQASIGSSPTRSVDHTPPTQVTPPMASPLPPVQEPSTPERLSEKTSLFFEGHTRAPSFKRDQRKFNLDLPDSEIDILNASDKARYHKVLENYLDLAKDAIDAGVRIDPSCVNFIRMSDRERLSPAAIDHEGVSHYVIPDVDDAIQTGSFGTVYLGAIGNSKVAIKVPSPGALQQDKIGTMDKLIHEARMLIRCGYHPSVVHLLGVHFESFERLWLIMEVVDGSDLHSVQYEQSIRHTPQAQYQIIKSVAEALCFLHSDVKHVQGSIVHRDVKPENILIGSKIVLCDFGNSEYSPDGIYNQLRGVTWYYAPPEILTLDAKMFSGNVPNIPEAGPSWDMWSFGCVILEIMGLPHPFAHFLSDDNLPPEAIREQFRDALSKGPFLPRISRSIEKPLLNLIVGALSRNWKERITARQFVVHLTSRASDVIDNLTKVQEALNRS